MVQLTTKRAALFLYGVLLVLPTAVLGGLQVHLILEEYREDMARVPDEARGAAERLSRVYREKLHELIEREHQRPFDHYASFYLVEDAEGGSPALVPSPLEVGECPEGILAWFDINLADTKAQPTFYWGCSTSPDQRHRLKDGLSFTARQIQLADIQDKWTLAGAGRDQDTSWARLAAMQAGGEQAIRAVKDNLDFLTSKVTQARATPLTVHFILEDDQSPRLVATRALLTMEGLDPELAHGIDPRLEPLVKGIWSSQGFFIDPAWFFVELPAALARDVLDEDQHFVPIDGEPCCDDRSEHTAEIWPVQEFGFRTEMPRDIQFGRMQVAVETSAISARRERQLWRFSGLAAMLALSLGTGLLLLLRSVGRDLEQARRTENFVAAVTHELRTPLSSIKLYGEMLLDGWATETDKRQDYYRRIVRETDRLSMLVERVLEKSRLSSGHTRPFPGDLNALIGKIEPRLRELGGSDGSDLHLDLAADLPAVWMTNDAITSILVNLIENARKYAPVDLHQPTAEPIRVVTRADPTRVLLEVLDRGPGISPKEAKVVFQAFYRTGHESTRTTRGTGLGLHLVALHAEAIGGSASVSARPDGGSAFRVALKRA